MAKKQALADAKKVAAELLGENEPRWRTYANTERYIWLGRWFSWDLWGLRMGGEPRFYRLLVLRGDSSGRVREYQDVSGFKIAEKACAEAKRRWKAREAA